MKTSGNSGQDGDNGLVPSPYMYKGKPYNSIDELEAAVVADPPSKVLSKSDGYRTLIKNILLFGSDKNLGLSDSDSLSNFKFPNIKQIDLSGERSPFFIGKDGKECPTDEGLLETDETHMGLNHPVQDKKSLHLDYPLKIIKHKLPQRGKMPISSQIDNIVFEINGKPLDLGFDMNEMTRLYELLILNNHYSMNNITLRDIVDELNGLVKKLKTKKYGLENIIDHSNSRDKFIFDYEADYSKAKIRGDYLEALNICAQAIRNTGNHNDLISLERWMNRQDEMLELAAKEVYEKLILTSRYEKAIQLCQYMYNYTFKRDQYKKLGDNYVKLFEVKKNTWEQRLDDLIDAIAERLYNNLLVIKDYKKIQELCLFMMKFEKQREDRNLTRTRTNIIKIKNSNSIWEKRFFNAGLDTYFKTDSKK